MFIIRILRWLAGYVHFTAWGNFLERFINLSASNKLNLWDMQKQDGVLLAKTSVKSYKKIRPYARKTNVRCRITKKKGLPFITHKYRRRVGLLIGALLFAAVLAISSQFVWSITITGNEEVSTEEIYQALEEYGLKIGARKSAVDYRILEEHVMIKLDKLSWMGIITKGTSVLIQVKERIMPPEFIALDTPCNVKAAKDGFIIRLEVYEGKTIVKSGNSVLKGDLIVSGIMEDSRGNSIAAVHARAKVIAQTEFSHTISVPLQKTVKEYTGETKSRYTISVLNFSFPSFGDKMTSENYDTEINSSQVNFLGITLPIILTKETISEYTPVTVRLTKDQAKEEALKLLEEYETGEFEGKGIVITSKITTDEITDSEYYLKATYYAQEDIAVEEEIGIDIHKTADK